jgi:predicted RND superfamily exporter protein
MTQLSIDDYLARAEDDKLNSRDWHFYNFLKLQEKPFKTQESMLEAYEDWLQRHFAGNEYSYGYFEEKALGKHFSDMTSGRNMRKTLRKLRENDTIQKIIGTNKIVNSVEEAEKVLAKRKAKWLKEAKIYWKEIKKLEKHLQTRLVFGKERDTIEAVLESEG